MFFKPVIPLKFGSKFLGLIILFTAFLATLTAFAGVFTLNLTARWEKELANQIVIEIPFSSNMQYEAEKVLTYLQTNNASNIHVLKTEEQVNLLTKWLGSNFDTSNLPLPIIIEAEAKKTATLTDLKTGITILVPSAEFSSNQDALKELKKIATTTKWAMLSALFTLITTLSIAIFFASNSIFMAYSEEIETLFILGATPFYILRQFILKIVPLALKNSGTGAIVASLVIFTGGFIVDKSTLLLGGYDMLYAIIIALGGTIIITLSAAIYCANNFLKHFAR